MFMRLAKKNGKPGVKGIDKCPTGILGLDQITGGGLPMGRPTLVCGGAGCGKTLLAMEFVVRGAMQFDEPGFLMSFEDNSKELVQNVASLGFDLDCLTACKKLALDFVHIEHSEIEETGEHDLKGLFARFAYAIDSVKAKRVVLDTIESLFSGLDNQSTLRAELRRLFRWLKTKGVTTIIAARPSLYGLEMHLATIYKAIERAKPAVVVMDPLTNLITTGSDAEARAMLLRLVDYLKSQQITSFFTSLTHGGNYLESTDVGISSLIDTWLLVRDIEICGERNRGLYILKSRGMAHSTQVRAFLLKDQGAKLVDIYLGSGGVLTGSARLAQEAQDIATAAARQQEITRIRRELQRKRKAA